MVEPLIEPRKRLVLDTDWMTAALAAVCFLFCLFGAVAVGWRVFTGAAVSLRITWQTGFALIFGTWLATQVRERASRFAVGLLVLSTGSRILLALVHASSAIQTSNSEVARVIDLLLMVGFCHYILRWLRTRLKRI
jgi:hypothetical protein